MRTLGHAYSSLSWAFGSGAVSSAEAAPEEGAELAKLCEHVLCRAPTVKLRIDDARYFEQTITPPRPILVGDSLSVFPGEALFIEATVEGETIKLDRAVASNEIRERTLQLTFKQMPGKGHAAHHHEPVPRWQSHSNGLHAARFEGDPQHVELSRPREAAPFEHWPLPIFLLLTDPKVVRTDDMACKQILVRVPAVSALTPLPCSGRGWNIARLAATRLH